MKLYGIVGAGGFGREIMPLVVSMLQPLLADSHYDIVFIDQKTDVKVINNHLVMSMDEFLSHTSSEKFFNIAIAHHEIRKKIAESLINAGVKPFTVKAVNHVDLGNNDIDEGAVWCPFTTITSNAKIGKFFHANIYSYVAHDCIIGDYVTFAPNVHCNGSVIIKDNVYVGTGVIIKQGTPDKPVIIGEGAVLGMGAVVTKSVPDYHTVIGNPARPLEPKHVQ